MSSDEITTWISKAPADQQAALAGLRELIKSLAPGVVEELKWSRPCYSTARGLFCYLQSTRHHAVLGFQRGASLSDPERLLEGSGKDMRHMKVKNGANFNESAVEALLKQALAH